MSGKSMWWIALVFSLFVGFAVWSSFSSGKARCDICMEFGGTRNCASAAGADVAVAERSARNAACATIANGVTASMQCEHSPAVSRSCSGP
jgi:hypothetical protein